MKPFFVTAPKDLDARNELVKLEPLFHRPELGTTRPDFERMTAPTFWEVGASGRRYSREYVLGILEDRLESPPDDAWQIEDFHCAEISGDNYLVTYTLI